MTKLIKPSSVEPATTTTAVAKPAKPAAPWPSPDKVKDLAGMLDRLHSYAEAMSKLAAQLEEGTIFTRRRILQEAEKVLEAFATTGWKNSLKSGHLQKFWDECFPESWWSDSGSPAYSQVARMITILMGSFPTSKIPEPEIFVRALIEDVMEFDPSFVVLESTCRQLRKTQKFMPSISEVIEALQEQQKLWRRRGNRWAPSRNLTTTCAPRLLGRRPLTHR